VIDRNSPTWLAVRAYCEERIRFCTDELVCESTELNPMTIAALRREIAVARSVLELEKSTNVRPE
jgi:hypothetical protein